MIGIILAMIPMLIELAPSFSLSLSIELEIWAAYLEWSELRNGIGEWLIVRLGFWLSSLLHIFDYLVDFSENVIQLNFGSLAVWSKILEMQNRVYSSCRACRCNWSTIVAWIWTRSLWGLSIAYRYFSSSSSSGSQLNFIRFDSNFKSDSTIVNLNWVFGLCFHQGRNFAFSVGAILPN